MQKNEIENKVKEIVEWATPDKEVDDWIYIFTPYFNFNDNEYDEVDNNKLFAYRLYVSLVKRNIIPKEIQYDILMCIYQWSDVDKSFRTYLRKAYKNIPHDKKKEYRKNYLQELKEHIDANGDIILYRGASAESIDIVKASSFTTNITVARHFAEHSLIKSKYDFSFIYTVKVNIKDIVWYGDNREEEEVVILPHCYGTKMKILNIKVFDIDDYSKNLRNKIDEFYEKNPIHFDSAINT